jgi:hypothetical protein
MGPSSLGGGGVHRFADGDVKKAKQKMVIYVFWGHYRALILKSWLFLQASTPVAIFFLLKRTLVTWVPREISRLWGTCLLPPNRKLSKLKKDLQIRNSKQQVF